MKGFPSLVDDWNFDRLNRIRQNGNFSLGAVGPTEGLSHRPSWGVTRLIALGWRDEGGSRSRKNQLLIFRFSAMPRRSGPSRHFARTFALSLRCANPEVPGEQSQLDAIFRPEFAVQARDVCFHRPLGDSQQRSNLQIVRSASHVPEHLALPDGEPSQLIRGGFVRLALPKALLEKLERKKSLALGHRLNRGQHRFAARGELVEVPSGSAAVAARNHVRAPRGGEDEGFDLWMVLPHFFEDGEAVHRRQPLVALEGEIDDRQLRVKLRYSSKKRLRISSLDHDAVSRCFEHVGEALAHQVMIFQNGNPGQARAGHIATSKPVRFLVYGRCTPCRTNSAVPRYMFDA